MWCMPKTEVYSWRIEPETKMALESELRVEGRSLAQLLNELAKDWLRSRNEQRRQEISEQNRLQALVKKFAGSISGEQTDSSENVREVVRKRVTERLRRNVS
jgi:hypothetical protein